MLTPLALALAALNPHAPPLTLEQAQALSPHALADQMLAPGHPDIVEVRVHPIGMEAPPGMGLTRIDLYDRAQPAPEDGFCVQTDYTIVFNRGYAAHPGPAAPVALEHTLLYRMANSPTGDRPGCEAPVGAFFRMRPAVHAEQIALLRRLAEARAAARASHAPTFPIHLDDKMTAPIPPLGTPLNALAELPLDTIYDIEPPDPSGTVAIEAEYGSWSIRVRTQDGVIVDLAIKRHIPYPF